MSWNDACECLTARRLKFLTSEATLNFGQTFVSDEDVKFAQLELLTPINESVKAEPNPPTQIEQVVDYEKFWNSIDE